ncbi:PAS domain S-box-containing protein [Kineococcus rhizosphaerae]|uniref:protein-serine/threonine phosphatase n=1 Tax=Kineococcus rhizosphaerae TaxID=559628 RepID=A0A2T0R001_9ACTN|nr:PAS domain S-box-containing protein [Kineococcus rhizosphaerae]
MVHDYPAAVMLVDTASNQIVYVNDLARQLAPDVTLPIDVEDWSRAAGLQVAAGGELVDSATPLTQVAQGDPERGRQISAALRSQATEAREALWAIGMPLLDAPPPLRARSLLILMPVRFPTAVADVTDAAVVGRAHRSVLASGLALAISDPTAEDDPLIWVSRSFEELTGYTREEVVGRNCRLLQGDDTLPADVAHLRDGIAQEQTVSKTILNYRQDGSAFYNHVVISPVFDAEGRLTHRVGVLTDVTGQVLAARELEEAHAEADRARKAQAAAEEVGRFGRLLLVLSESLTATVTVEDVAATVSDVVARELGAAGGGLLLADATQTHLDFVSMDAMPQDTDAAWSRLTWNEDAPISLAARSRQGVFYRDHHALAKAHPSITEHADVPAMGATANVPLLLGRDVVGVIFLFWNEPHVLPTAQRAALQAAARYTAQAVQRATLIAERRTAAETLQNSLLTRLPEPDHLELRARYVPAATEEHVGGDWYDAITLPDGATTLVIGDVTGHDMTAAAHMGQLRGLLRAFAFDREEPPADIVNRLDRALLGLHIDGLATLVLARIEQTEDDAQAGLRRLRWTNAGHLPPVLLLADGTTRVLDTEPEMLIGLAPDSPRSNHSEALPPGSTLLLYTDGLVEHRGRSITDGVDDLRQVLTGAKDLPLEELLDRVVDELVGDSPDDDCAMLAVRAHRQDRPRPAEAGPNRSA